MLGGGGGESLILSVRKWRFTCAFAIVSFKGGSLVELIKKGKS